MMVLNTATREITKTIQHDGAQKLHVLSDFDRTLTKPIINGKRVDSLVSVLRNHGYLTPEYPKKAQKLFDTYYPIEIDPSVPVEIKKEKMHTWWSKHFELLIASGLTRQDIKNAMTSQHAELRDGAKHFFNLLHKNNIPLVIMSSSGLGVESIAYFLDHRGLLTKNVYIISNRFTWDDSGKALSVVEPIIHGMNKDETLISSFPHAFQAIHHRPNVILLGDTTSDLGMIDGFDYHTMISFGYCEKETQNNDRHFDKLLPETESLEPITSLIEKIIFNKPL